MSTTDITKIYENLFRLESKLNKKGAYPIHKKLSIPNHQDIYDWISKKYNFPVGGKVLDAGCGVGFGTLLLAQKHDIAIDGISLSESEVSQATINAQQTQFADRVSFRMRSFDDLPKGNYDLIIAVESVKHSLNLDHSLQVLVAALKPKGQLIIVEDFYHSNALTSAAKSYVKDWALVDAFRESDYLAILDSTSVQWSDLTRFMSRKRVYPIYLRLFLFTIGSWFKGGMSLNIYQIFRGGFYLDLLYANKLMSYKALHYQKQ